MNARPLLLGLLIAPALLLAAAPTASADEICRWVVRPIDLYSPRVSQPDRTVTPPDVPGGSTTVPGQDVGPIHTDDFTVTRDPIDTGSYTVPGFTLERTHLIWFEGVYVCVPVPS